jgi:hypothetical protein
MFLIVTQPVRWGGSLIDEQVYHIGASLKDLGKKWFAFSKLNKDGLKILEKIQFY